MINNKQLTKNYNNQMQYLYWTHLDHPKQEELEKVRTQYDFPTDFIHGTLDPYEVSRTDEFINDEGEKFVMHVFLYPIVDAVSSNKDRYQVSSLTIIQFEDQVITLSNTTIPFIESWLKVDGFEIENQLTGFTFTMALFWKISQKYIEILIEIDKTILELEQKVSYSTDNEILYQLIGINKGLIYFGSAIDGNQHILEHMERNLDGNEKTEERRDTMIRNVKIEQHQASVMIDNLQDVTEKLSNMLSNVISNNMNQIMKFLTAVSILLTIPNIIGALWGMNVALPWEYHDFAFLILGGLTIAIVAVVYYVLRKTNRF